MIYTDESNVTVTFDDETTASGSLVVGCDGPKSKVREAIFGIEKGSAKPVGQRLSNLVVNYRYVTRNLGDVKLGNPSYPLSPLMDECVIRKNKEWERKKQQEKNYQHEWKI